MRSPDPDPPDPTEVIAERDEIDQIPPSQSGERHLRARDGQARRSEKTCGRRPKSMRLHAGCADEWAIAEGAHVHRERAAVCRPSIEQRQWHRPAPDGDGTLVAQELIRSQPRSVFIRADPALGLLPLEGIEIGSICGKAALRAHAAERGLEVSSPEATGIRSGVQRLSHGEGRAETGGQRAWSGHRDTIAGLRRCRFGFPQAGGCSVPVAVRAAPRGGRRQQLRPERSGTVGGGTNCDRKPAAATQASRRRSCAMPPSTSMNVPVVEPAAGLTR